MLTSGTEGPCRRETPVAKNPCLRVRVRLQTGSGCTKLNTPDVMLPVRNPAGNCGPPAKPVYLSTSPRAALFFGKGVGEFARIRERLVAGGEPVLLQQKGENIEGLLRRESCAGIIRHRTSDLSPHA